MYLPSQGIGPRIRRYDVRKQGENWYSCDFTETEEPVLLDDPERLAYARKDVDAFWRFRTLAKELEPALRQRGVELLDGSDSTPDGRIIFWALAETPPANRAAVSCNDNAFYLVSRAIGRLLRTGRTLPDNRNENTNDKIIATLCTIHKYDAGSVGCSEPAKVGTIAETAGVAKGTISKFFRRTEFFNDYAGYCRSCRTNQIAFHLKMLNREFSELASLDPAKMNERTEEE